MSRKVHYTSFVNKGNWEAVPAEDFLAVVQDPKFIGNPLLQTQHFVGLSTWDKASNDEIVGRHQLRVAHQLMNGDRVKKVQAKCHNHGNATVWYKRIDGVWKFAGLKPNGRWSEGDFGAVFG